jgi:hypothetical protein
MTIDEKYKIEEPTLTIHAPKICHAATIWKSLRKTRVDLNALREKGYRISLWHGENDSLYRVSRVKQPSKNTE